MGRSTEAGAGAAGDVPHDTGGGGNPPPALPQETGGRDLHMPALVSCIEGWRFWYGEQLLLLADNADLFLSLIEQ